MGKYAKVPLNYQMAACKIFHMTTKYNNVSILKPSKIYPNWDFWFENKPSGSPDGYLVADVWHVVELLQHGVHVARGAGVLEADKVARSAPLDRRLVLELLRQALVVAVVHADLGTI
jgi:hypothetical protein